MTKTIPTRRRPSPEEALLVAASHAPELPPTRMEASDRSTTLNLRLRESTVDAITRHARAQGLTIKQLVMEGAKRMGVPVAASDLEDRTPRRKGVGM